MEEYDVSFNVIAHSCIRVEGSGRVIYFDPFMINDAAHDADAIFITHEHYDHMSPEDIARVEKPDTVFVLPASCLEAAKKAGIDIDRTVTVNPGESGSAAGLEFEAVPAYNIGRPFHQPQFNWVGYVVTIGGDRVYVCGDTDSLDVNTSIKCDTMFVPVGGTYTMTPGQAAGYAAQVKPKLAIPTHYGSIVGNKDDGQKFADILSELAPDIEVIVMLPKQELL